MAESSDLALFVGRFHLVLLHLPIGFLLLLTALELLGRPRGSQETVPCASRILALAAPASLVTAACGWLLARGGGYDAELLWWHRWLGVAAVGLCVVTAFLRRSGASRSYRFTLFATVMVLTVTSHFGGSITHGKGFLTRHAPAPLRRLVGAEGGTAMSAAKPDPAAARPVFASVIQPILDRACVSCHGPDKAKGKLRLDSLEALLQGGDAGPTITAGRAMESELMKRMLLPLDHDEHMPPEGKPQPTADEITLLKWWIDAGAAGDKTLAELSPPAEILKLIEASAR